MEAKGSNWQLRLLLHHSPSHLQTQEYLSRRLLQTQLLHLLLEYQVKPLRRVLRLPQGIKVTR